MKHVASAPAKVILFGEWAVLDGGPGVAMALAPRLRVSWRVPEESRDDATLMIRGENQMALWDPKTAADKNPQIPSFLKMTVKILEALMRLDAVADRGLARGGEIRVERDWELDRGYGSSSAIVAALLELVAPDRERLEKWHLGRETIRRAQGSQASGLDLAAQLRGGFVSFAKDKPRPLALELPPEILFLYGKQKADTSDFVRENRVPAEARAQLAKSCEKFLETRDWIAALREHAEILATCDVWPEDLRRAREQWLARDLVRGMKSCGAGGGDTWMLWCAPDKQDGLRAEAASKGWTVERPEVAHVGSRREDT
jgi:mevalonate kinase